MGKRALSGHVECTVLREIGIPSQSLKYTRWGANVSIRFDAGNFVPSRVADFAPADRSLLCNILASSSRKMNKRCGELLLFNFSTVSGRLKRWLRIFEPSAVRCELNLRFFEVPRWIFFKIFLYTVFTNGRFSQDVCTKIRIVWHTCCLGNRWSTFSFVNIRLELIESQILFTIRNINTNYMKLKLYEIYNNTKLTNISI